MVDGLVRWSEIMAVDAAADVAAPVEHCPGWLIEAVIHGWDTCNAVRDLRPIDPDTAVVGLDEFIGVMALDQVPGAVVRPVELRATDRVWTGVLPSVGAPGAAALMLEGTASDLLLALWRRVPVADVAVAAALARIDLS